MSSQMSDEEIRRKAWARVHAKRGFFIHLSVYIIVNAFLVCMWAVSMAGGNWGSGWGMHAGRGYFWPLWIIVFWGIGLVVHCLSVFVFHGNWEQKEVEKEVQRIKKSAG